MKTWFYLSKLKIVDVIYIFILLYTNKWKLIQISVVFWPVTLNIIFADSKSPKTFENIQ